MTSEIGKTTSKRGFTLLEICICLCIMAVLMGAAIPNLNGWIKEQRLRDPARYLSSLARTARLRAIENQRSYRINFQADRMWLEPTLPPIPTTPSDPNGPSPTTPAVPLEAPESLPAPYVIPDSTVVLIQPWNESKMRPPGHSSWTFSPDGLCEPLAVTFIQGASQLELDFDPLTATVANEKFYRP